MEKFNNREAYDALLRTAEAIRSFGTCEFNGLYKYKAPFWTVAAEAVRNGYQAVGRQTCSSGNRLTVFKP